jgi:outer membrane protein assembly factor BamB
MDKKTLILLFALCVYAAAAYGAVILDADWPLPGHDLYHSGYSNVLSYMEPEDISLLYTFEEKGEFTSPVTADINGDGMAEILLGSTDNNIYALNSEAKELWRFTAGGATSTPAVFDLLLDNATQILFASKDGKVYALDSNGSLLWSYQTNGSISSTPMAVNVDYRPELEVLTASEDKFLYILDAQGNKIRTHLIADPFLSTLCIGDVNSDGKPDYFMGAYNNKMDSLISPENRRLAFDTGGSVTTPVYIPDGVDGRPRVIISSGDGKVYSLFYEEYTKIPEGSHEIISYSSMTKEWQYNLSGEVSSSPAVSDLNADGFSEVIVGTKGKVLYILDPLGKVLEKHSINGKILASPVSADLDGDGLPEIILGSSDGLLHILNGSGFRKWSYETKSIITQSAAVSDLDRNGVAEILLSAGNKLYIFGEKTLTENPTTTLSAVSSTTTTTIVVTTTTQISTTTTSSTTTMIVTPTLKTTTTTLNKQVASVGFNDFIIFMLVMVIMFVAVGGAAKFLHNKYTKPKSAATTPIQNKKDASRKKPAAPKPKDAGEPTLKGNKNVLRTLIEELMRFLGAATKFLHNRFTQKKNAAEKPVKVKKDTSLQDLALPKLQEPQSPLITAEEKTVEEYKDALNTLIEEEKNLPVVVHYENTLPALDEEHKEFLNDLKTLEKEGKRKY